MAEQVLPHKIGDTVYEKHVYTGPQGHGFIDFEYKVNGTDLEMKRTHSGPENRPSHDFQVIPDRTVTEKQQTGTTTETVDEVTVIESPPNSGNYQRIVTAKQVTVPVFADVQVTKKHPYKERFFGL